MIIHGIDPGPETSGTVVFDTSTRSVLLARKDRPNDELLDYLRARESDPNTGSILACECIEAMYAHVGKETVRTIRFVGQIEERCFGQLKFIGMSPQEVKKIVCGTAAAKDPAVRQALIDQIGPVGTKKAKGPCFGVSGHAWRALAVAVAASRVIENVEVSREK